MSFKLPRLKPQGAKALLLWALLASAVTVLLVVMLLPRDVRKERVFVSKLAGAHRSGCSAHSAAAYGKVPVHAEPPRFPPAATLQVTAFDAAEVQAAPF
jgi:hypothetical protein